MEEEFYLESQESLNTLFCNTFKSTKSAQQDKNGYLSGRYGLSNVGRDDSLATVYRVDESMN